MSIDLNLTDRKENRDASVSSITVAKPDNLAENELVLLHVSSYNRDINTPTNFTEIVRTSTNRFAQSGVFAKLATGAEPNTYEVTVDGGTTNLRAVSLRVTGINTNNIMAVMQAASRGATSSGSSVPSITLDSITPAVDDSLLVSFVSTYAVASRSMTEPGGMSSAYDYMADIPGQVGASQQLTTGATGDKTWTIDGADVNSSLETALSAVMFAIPPGEASEEIQIASVGLEIPEDLEADESL